MNIGFNHKGVAPPTQGCAVLFYQCMPSCDDDLVQLVQQLRREQANVIYQCLIGVFLAFIKQAMSEHLPQGSMLVDQFMKTVVIDIQVQTQYTTNQDIP